MNDSLTCFANFANFLLILFGGLLTLLSLAFAFWLFADSKTRCHYISQYSRTAGTIAIYGDRHFAIDSLIYVSVDHNEVLKAYNSLGNKCSEVNANE